MSFVMDWEAYDEGVRERKEADFERWFAHREEDDKDLIEALIGDGDRMEEEFDVALMEQPPPLPKCTVCGYEIPPEWAACERCVLLLEVKIPRRIKKALNKSTLNRTSAEQQRVNRFLEKVKV